MSYALRLDSKNRILSATFDKYASKDMAIVESIPEGDVYDYQYIDGEYVYNPLPKPEVEPTETEDILAMMIDHEYRLTLLELGLTE